MRDFAKGDKKIAVMAGADQLQMLQKLGVPEGQHRHYRLQCRRNFHRFNGPR